MGLKGMIGAAAWACASAAAAQASETVTYTYDALGRLIAVTTSGGPNDGQAIVTCYDRAGNRMSHSVATGTPPPPCPPPPPPPPAPPRGSARLAATDRADA
jgi:YD repeat-containing protein